MKDFLVILLVCLYSTVLALVSDDQNSIVSEYEILPGLIFNMNDYMENDGDETEQGALDDENEESKLDDDENEESELDDDENEECEHDDDENELGDDGIEQSELDDSVPSSNCWMTLNAAEHFKIMDEIDDRYADVRQAVQEELEESDFDKEMIKGFKASRGTAHREVNAQKTRMIPSGLNLGGFCMVRMPESILFFHRMKLRNNTFFTVNYLHNDLSNMMIRINLGLNDLHLMGAYERSLSDGRPNILIYSPTFGQVEFLLKDVKYKIEGRYRVVRNRLMIELISSEIICNEILMTYMNQAIKSTAIRIEKQNLGGFLSKMKTDLDQWLKDYFNDYLTLEADMDNIPDMSELSKYDKEKTTALEEFTDKSIHAIVTRIRLMNGETIRVPTFTFRSIHGLEIKLYDGVLHGLDSMYRRSVATGHKQGKIRKVDTVVGFSNLKVVYKYEAAVPTALPPLTGLLTLSANELTAHVAIAMVSDPETVDLDIEFLGQTKPESLTLEGSANILMANFKHLLEHQILAIMSNSLIYSVVMLKSLPRCEPFLPGHIVKKETEDAYDTPESFSSEETNDLLRKKTHSRQRSPKKQQKPKTHSRQRSPKKQQKPIMKQSNASKILKKNQKKHRKITARKKSIPKRNNRHGFF